MKHGFQTKVFYSDTDAYGVVWHGSYLRWLEMGRVMLCEDAGLNLKELEKEDIILPVSNIDIKYKISAKLDDVVKIDTKIKEIGKYYITFYQKVTDEKEQKTYIEADVKVVSIHRDGKLYRSLPEQLQKLAR